MSEDTQLGFEDQLGARIRRVFTNSTHLPFLKSHFEKNFSIEKYLTRESLTEGEEGSVRLTSLH